MVTKPILNAMIAFDATNPATFTFYSVGGNQVVKNQLTIRNNSTNQIIYQNSVETFKFEHTVPGGTLTNGTYYNASIIAYDATGEASTPSEPIQFWCHSAPTLTFTNIPPTLIINASSFLFEFTYNQTQGELLNYYSVILYNSNHSEINNSGEIYPGAGAPPLALSYLLTGFDDRTSYYIEVKGYTVNGTLVTTGQTLFTVTYSSPSVFGILGLTNDCKEGYITGESIISIIEGESNPSPPIFIDNATGQEIDLRGEGHWVRWVSGFQANGDFTAQWWMRDMNPDTEISYFYNNIGQKITFTYRHGYYRNETVMKAYIELWCTNNAIAGDIYFRYSNYIDLPTDTDYLTLWVRRIGNIYDIMLVNLGPVIPVAKVIGGGENV